MPIATTHKGVGIHAGQPAKRVALVKKEIDKVARISDLMRLYEIAGDVSWSPEARVFAGARCRAGLEIAIERREARPAIGVEAIECRIAGCGRSHRRGGVRLFTRNGHDWTGRFPLISTVLAVIANRLCLDLWLK